jgi:hypothetical protein
MDVVVISPPVCITITGVSNRFPFGKATSIMVSDDCMTVLINVLPITIEGGDDGPMPKFVLLI